MTTIIRGSAHAIKSMRNLGHQCRATMTPFRSSSVITGSNKSQRFNLPSILRQPFTTKHNICYKAVNSNSKTFRLFSSGSSSGGGGNGCGGSGGGGNGGGGNGGAGGLWTAYLALLDRKPIATKGVTAALLNGLGDLVAQKYFGDDTSKFDWKRLGIFTFLGMVLIGPALHFWYTSLSRIVTSTGTIGALKRLSMDQLLFAPIFLSAIIGSIMTLEGHADKVPQKLRSDLFTIVRSNWVLWVPFQFINFRYVPVQLQVLASNVVALAWNTYMSWASHNSTSA